MISINSFLFAYLLIYLISSLTEILIDLINEVHLRRNGNSVPSGFSELIDSEKLREMNDYTVDNLRLSILKTLTGKIVFLLIILSGLMPWLAESLGSLHFTAAGLIFFAVPSLISGLIGLPLGYYQIFRIEERYGFNTRSFGTWVSDLIKSLLIAVLFGAILLSLLLIIIEYTGSGWWFWAWIIFFSFQILMAVIYPTVIAPVFNKFTPIGDEELERSIREITDREGLTVKDVFRMDAARRSRHTNAYFSGLGKSKRIVLYDTLLESHEKKEILAVLAHEIGHLKKAHIRKNIIIVAFISFVLFFISSRVITWDTMYRSFGFSSMPAYAGLFLLTALWEPFGFLLSPLFMAVSRRFEREADGYAYRVMNTVQPLVSALKKMALHNLSNLNPHPMYIRFNYSHPPLLERVRNLQSMSDP